MDRKKTVVRQEAGFFVRLAGVLALLACVCGTAPLAAQIPARGGRGGEGSEDQFGGFAGSVLVFGFQGWLILQAELQGYNEFGMKNTASIVTSRTGNFDSVRSIPSE